MNKILSLGVVAFAVPLLAARGESNGRLSGTYRLQGANPSPGAHCESAAIVNALRYEGYEVSEPMILGGGGALSFTFGEGAFPFIGGRSLDLRERFFSTAEISWTSRIPQGRDLGWQEITDLLGRGIPVVLRVDMRFLPYRYGGKYGPSRMSFGWHLVTLFGVDWDAGLAWVSDREYDGLQKIKIADLSRARSSTTKTFPPRAEYYWMEPPEGSEGRKIVFSRLVSSSFETITEHYENGALDSLSRFGSALSSYDANGVNGFLLPAALRYMSGCIEEYGTGGAAFREPYKAFIAEAERSGAVADAETLTAALDASIAAWHELSSQMRSFADGAKSMGKAERSRNFILLGNCADALYARERILYTEIKRRSEAPREGE